MGLFERNDYGRDYRRERGPGMRGGWQRWEGDRQRGEGRYGAPRGESYDRDWQRRAHGYDAGSFAYRGLDGAWSTAFNRGAHDPEWDWHQAARGNRQPYSPGTGYDGGYRGSSQQGYGRDYRGGPRGWEQGYGRPRGEEVSWRESAGYDREYARRPRPHPGWRGGW